MQALLCILIDRSLTGHACFVLYLLSHSHIIGRYIAIYLGIIPSMNTCMCMCHRAIIKLYLHTVLKQAGGHCILSLLIYCYLQIRCACMHALYILFIVLDIAYIRRLIYYYNKQLHGSGTLLNTS